jgi:L-fuculose-phosphate aldolase
MAVRDVSRPAAEARVSRTRGSRNDRALREAIVVTARAMNTTGINRGTAGNVSARTSGGFLITPSAVPYDVTTADHVVAVSDSGEPTGALAPSTEWRFHREIYRNRPDLHAIVHTHSPFATTVACLGRRIPAFHYKVAIAGGNDIRCAPYATFGTQELADHVVGAMAGRKACLMSHHGMIAADATLSQALALAIEVETLAEMYWRALQIGEPSVLSDSEMNLVLNKFAAYGKTG